MSNIVNLDEYRLAKNSKNKDNGISNKKCDHLDFAVSPTKNIPVCKDCGESVDPISVLKIFKEQLKSQQEEIDAQGRFLTLVRNAKIHSISAKKVEKAWKMEKSLPICPHCKEGISHNDGFGDSFIDSQIDAARRLVRSRTQDNKKPDNDPVK